MGVFFGLGDAKLLQAGVRHHFAEDAFEFDGGEQAGQETVEMTGIFDHAASRRPIDAGLAGKFVEVGIEQGGENLTHAVGAEIAGQQTVARRHAGVIADHHGGHEFVRLAAPVGGVDRLKGVAGGRAVRGNQGVVGPGDAIPTPVAVHGVIAPGDGDDLEIIQRAGLFYDVGDIIPPARRRRVAAIEKGMKPYRNPGVTKNFGQRHQMILMRVHPAR